MSRMREWVALLVCVTMVASSTLHAQARGSAPREQRSSEKKTKNQEVPVGKVVSDSMSANPEAWAAVRAGRAIDERERVGRDMIIGSGERKVVLDAMARARKIAEMEVWLGRLLGRFRIDGTYESAVGSSEVQGIAECAGIGDGAGVHCLINMAGTAIYDNQRKKLRREVSSALGNTLKILGQMGILYGINPETLMIETVWVTGLAQRKSGVLNDDAVSFVMEQGCELYVTRCSFGSVVTASPGGDVTMKFQATTLLLAEFNLRLHRDPSVATANSRNEVP